MPFLPPNQQCQSTEGRRKTKVNIITATTFQTAEIPSFLGNINKQRNEANDN